MSIKAKYITGSLIAFFLVIGAVYATNTLIDNIAGGQRVDNGAESISGKKISTIETGSLMFIDEGDNDDAGAGNFIGNFFSGYYLDEGYGLFKMNKFSGKFVSIKAQENIVSCNAGYTAYSLEGYAYSEYYGIVDFDVDTIGVCVNRTSGIAYFKGYVLGEYVGIQDFGDNKIVFEPVLDNENTINDQLGEDGVLGRYVKVEGATSSSTASLTSEFDDEVRVVGEVSKSSLRQEIAEAVYTKVKGVTLNNGSLGVPSLSSISWGGADGVKLQDNKILYFGELTGERVDIAGHNDIEGQKTLIVIGGDVYIEGDIRNSDDSDDLLGIIVLANEQGQGGNILINPSVTDVHAILYAERSLLSFDGTNQHDGNTSDEDLANQLYIHGSVFSENTLGGAETNTCPYYVNETCTNALAKKYDFNYLRRYRLIQEIDEFGDMVGYVPEFDGREAYMGDDDRDNNTSNPATSDDQGNRMYPFVIEYNSSIQTGSLPVFNN